MNNDHVKSIVAQTNVIVQTGDTGLQSNEARNLMSSLLLALCSQSAKNPYFAITIYQYLLDQGFEVNGFRGEAMGSFMTKFGKKLEGVDDVQRVTIRQISSRLFSPTRI